jgi:hypothetical protein
VVLEHGIAVALAKSLIMVFDLRMSAVLTIHCWLIIPAEHVTSEASPNTDGKPILNASSASPLE